MGGKRQGSGLVERNTIACVLSAMRSNSFGGRASRSTSWMKGSRMNMEFVAGRPAATWGSVLRMLEAETRAIFSSGLIATAMGGPMTLW